MSEHADLGRSLAGQVAVVTGAARGLGQEVARQLAAAGAVVEGFDLGPMDETVALITGQGATAGGHSVDVTDERSVDAATDAVLEEHGRIDILVNNAGRWIDLQRRPFWEIDAGEFDDMMAVNARSVFVVSRAVSAPMRGAGSGRIVNFTSATVSFGMPDLIHYVAAKAAVVGLTRSMATELAPYGITCNAVAPGLVPTAAGRAVMSPDFYEGVMQTQLLKQPITPPDIAGGVLYLCSPAARMVTGEVLTISAGSTMGGV